MTVLLEDTLIRLQGPCGVEEAETLTSLLQSQPDAVVDVSACTALHGAVLQVMLAFGPSIIGEPNDAFLRDHLLPALAARQGRKADTSAGFERLSAPVQGVQE